MLEAPLRNDMARRQLFPDPPPAMPSRALPDFFDFSFGLGIVSPESIPLVPELIFSPNAEMESEPASALSRLYPLVDDDVPDNDASSQHSTSTSVYFTANQPYQRYRCNLDELESDESEWLYSDETLESDESLQRDEKAERAGCSAQDSECLDEKTVSPQLPIRRTRGKSDTYNFD